MRTIAELPRPDCKITIFSMNSKFIIKFEQGTLEQIYKLSELDLIDGVNDIFQLLDDEFISTVVKRFDAMSDDLTNALKKYGL